jgi:hypothetical protein
MKPTSIFALTLLAAVPALAQNDTSWVSHSGSDSNPCTLDAPCLTFNAAYFVTNNNGIIKAMDAGEYGIISIYKPIILDGNGVGAAIAASSGSGVGIFTSSPVEIRNLGIYVQNGCGCDGIDSFSGNVTIENVSVTGGPSVGVLVSGGTATLKGVTVSGANGGGIASGAGIQVQDGTATISDSVVQYSAIGVLVQGSTAATRVRIEGSQMIANTIGLQVNNSGAAATARISDNVIAANAAGTATANGGQIITLRNNTWAANTADGSTPFSISLK